jgi:hypothetical protein
MPALALIIALPSRLGFFRAAHRRRGYDFMCNVRVDGTIPRDSIGLPALPQIRHLAAARLTPRKDNEESIEPNRGSCD